MPRKDEQKSEQEKLVTCRACLKEIPVSATVSYEGPDYVAHFCGAGCLDRFLGKEPGEACDAGNRAPAHADGKGEKR